MEILARIVCVKHLILFKKKKVTKKLYLDDACWEKPCEACLPIAWNSRNYTCACGIKFWHPVCPSSKILFILLSFTFFKISKIGPLIMFCSVNIN